jgi:CubicO group peptidase (beta-lactamase class C family)
MVETRKLEDILAAWMDRHTTPGLAVAIVLNADVVLLRGYGRTGVDEGAALVTETTLFRILSTTKMLVGTVVMRLVERGALALDTPISQYLPWLHLSRAGLEDRIALRHLLSHTSGLCTFPGDFTSRDPDGLDVWAHEYLPRYPVLTPPGQVWLYSNSGLSLAAYVAQSVTETPFAHLMDELLFAPLDMDHTTFDPLVALTYPCAQGHRRSPDGAWEVDHQFVQNTAWDPAGGALSCVQDLSQVALLYLRHGALGAQRLLSAETIALMQTPHVKSWTRDEDGYGLTWATYEHKGQTLVRHNGGGVSSFQSVFILAPTQDMGLVLLANGGLTGELVRELLDAALEAPAQEPHPALPAGFEADWPAFCGTYLGPYTGMVVVEMEGKRLSLTRNGTRYALEPHCERHYLGTANDSLDVISVGFPAGRSPADRAEFVVVDDSPCERLASPPALTADPESWSRFVGSYELPLGTMMPERSLHVDAEGQTLFLTFRAQRMRCLPVSAMTFACDAGVIAFRETLGEIVLEFQQTMQARRTSNLEGE